MVINIIYGITFGMTLQIGIGPVNIATWMFGLTEGWRKSAKVALGVALADLTYIIISMVISRYTKQLMWVDLLLYITSAMFLFKLAYKSFKAGKEVDNTIVFKGNLIKSGYLINIVNPKAIILWYSVFNIVNNTSLLFAVGISMSTLLWLGFMPLVFQVAMSKNIQSRLNKGLQYRAKYILGTVFMVYGIITLVSSVNIIRTALN